MQKTALKLFLLLTGLAAVGLAMFWAVRPLDMQFFNLLLNMGWGDADVLNRFWHFRLVPPEWISYPPDYYRWAQAETLARLTVIFIAWAAITLFIERRYFRSQKTHDT
jgi:hypothetical protein